MNGSRKREIVLGCLTLVLGLTAIQCGPKHEEPAPPSVPAAENTAVSPQSEAGTNAAEAAPVEEFAGEIFGSPVAAGNYYFAKRVHSIFQRPEEKDLSPEEMERVIWHNLVLSFEAYRRKIEVTPEEFSQWVDSVLAALELPFTRTKDPEAYKKWAEEELKQSVEIFENQMRYLANIEKLRREIVKEMQVTVSEEELKDDYLNVENHVGGEYQIFETKAEADAFYEAHSTEKKWEKYKKQNPDKIKQFHPITLQAIIDLWGVPRDLIYEFHALDTGKVGRPMPFGNKWGVFRLTEKRSGDLKLFPDQREACLKRVESRKKFQAAEQWLKDIYDQANVKVWLPAESAPAKTASQEGAPAVS